MTVELKLSFVGIGDTVTLKHRNLKTENTVIAQEVGVASLKGDDLVFDTTKWEIVRLVKTGSNPTEPGYYEGSIGRAPDLPPFVFLLDTENQWWYTPGWYQASPEFLAETGVKFIGVKP